MRSILSDKRGISGERIFHYVAISIFILAILTFVAAVYKFEERLSFLTTVGDFSGKYIFGLDETAVSEVTTGRFTSTGGAILTFMMVWLIIFVTFGDIISGFSSFSPLISWTIALALATIAANAGLITKGFLWITTIFIWAGTAAVYLGLLASFAVFMLINWGLGGWLVKARMKREGQVSEQGAESGARGLKTLARVDRTAIKEGHKSQLT